MHAILRLWTQLAAGLVGSKAPVSVRADELRTIAGLAGVDLPADLDVNRRGATKVPANAIVELVEAATRRANAPRRITPRPTPVEIVVPTDDPAHDEAPDGSEAAEPTPAATPTGDAATDESASPAEAVTDDDEARTDGETLLAEIPGIKPEQVDKLAAGGLTTLAHYDAHVAEHPLTTIEGIGKAGSAAIVDAIAAHRGETDDDDPADA